MRLRTRGDSRTSPFFARFRRPPIIAAIALLAIGTRGELLASPSRSANVTCGGRLASIVGTDSPDTLVGTPQSDVIAGLAGNDGINGKGGNDIACGGSGNDMVVGGDGADRLFGGAGNDYLLGGAGKNRLLGGSGRGDLCLAGVVGRSYVTCEGKSAGRGCPPAFAVEYGVRNPERFTINNPCRTATGKVSHTPRAEADGDRTYDITDEATALTFHVEEVPRDQRHLPLPIAGERVAITGANVQDDHGRNELHPVFVLRRSDGTTYYSGPRYGGIPPSSSAYCWTSTGATCPPW
jgi:RTX calcium-binding nonapeptide repeat (4 copies)